MRISKRLLSLLLSLALLLGLASCDLFSLLPNADDDTPFTPTVYTQVVKENFEHTYGDQLSPNERAIYDAVKVLPPATESLNVTLPEVPAVCKGRKPTDAEMDALGKDITTFIANAFYAAWLDFPTLFWLDHTQYSYDISVSGGDDNVVRLSKLELHLTLTATPEEIHEQNEALSRATAGFIPLGKTPADKVAYINNYLCSRIKYDLEAENRGSIVGALVDGKCVCEGYARAFDYLCEKAGIDAICIPGYGYTDDTPDGEGHMWNAVRLDGVLYAVDTTWNDTTKKNSYLLVGTDTLCNNKAFGESHIPDMLTLDGPHKAFALPAIAKLGHGIEP